jgi:hypothetical protein
MSNCSCSVSWHPIFVTNVTGCSRRYHCRLTSSAAGCAARRCGAWRCGVCAIERARSLSRKSLGKRKRLFRGPPSDNASSARSTPNFFELKTYLKALAEIQKTITILQIFRISSKSKICFESSTLLFQTFWQNMLFLYE